jgi:aquaporin Z
MRSSVAGHWPEYLMEASLLGGFMISVCLLVTAFESPRLPLYFWFPNSNFRTIGLALAIGVTAALLIQSPWGKRSGAHMNPAITIAFLRLKKIHPWDALFYTFAQTIGGTLGVVAVAIVVGPLFTGPPVQYAVTVPGSGGAAVALAAETVISFVLMATILAFNTSPRLVRFTGLAVGCVVAFLIIVEAPLSGTSMNPARTLASAIPGMIWQHVWIYLVGPTLGMLIAAQIHLKVDDGNGSGCAKLLHPRNVRCIHCGYLCHQE